MIILFTFEYHRIMAKIAIRRGNTITLLNDIMLANEQGMMVGRLLS